MLTLKGPDLGHLYDRAAQHHSPERNPIIVIPGLLGTKLVEARTGRIVWGAFERRAANPREPEGARLVALPLREHAAAPEIVPAGVLDRPATTCVTARSRCRKTARCRC